MKHQNRISAVINVRNEADKLTKCLRSLKGFADEIIVVDMHSTDNSVAIAQSYGARVFSYRPMRYVEPARNFGLSKATGQWIILLDPDEYLKKPLKHELLKVKQRKDIDFVKIPRKNINFGKWIRHSRCWPDYLIRFFKKGQVVWQKEIHSQPVTKGNGLTLLDSEKMAIHHHNYDTVNSFILRTIRYASIQADELMTANYKIRVSDLILKPIQEFNSRFFAGEGYKDGFHGLIFCLLQAFAISLVYIRLWEKNGAEDKVLSKDSYISGSQEAIFEYSYWFTRFFNQDGGQNIVKQFFIYLRHLLNRLTKNF